MRTLSKSAEKLLSSFDLTEPGEEQDPLNEVFGEGEGEYRITTAPESVEERLAELEGLKTKGLVSEREYRAQRVRILQQL